MAYCWRTNPQDTPKNFGGQCPLLGNPIHGGIGNKYQAEADYTGAGTMPLNFTRHYNSRLLRNYAAPNLNLGHWSNLGPNWRSSYDRFIGFAGLETRFPTAYVYRPDGKVFHFKLANGQFVPDADISETLVRLTDGSGNTTGWEYTTEKDEVEAYDAAGSLVSITNRAGLTQTLTYDNKGRLSTVSDAFGRQLSFTYDTSNRVATMTDPAGGVYTYGYNSLNNISSVTYPNGKVRSYVYNESANIPSGYSFPYALTGIIDENGNRFATYKYDFFGRAISTEHAGGAEKVTLGYNYNGTTTVTDALGTARNYTFQTILGVVKNTGISQPCTNCGGGACAMTYDVNGNIATRKDFNGNRTNYTYDLTRNLETQRVEGLTSTGGTTAQTRTITTQWHPLYRLPTQITEPGRVTALSYDPNGNLLSKTVTAGTKTRTWAYTYNTLGQVLTANGPRTDVSDVTAFTYDAQGNVATITNALGHVTRITHFDAHGHPLSITDPNGLVTQLSYDARGRLTSRTVGSETTTYEYDGVGQLKKVTLPTSAYLSYTYDVAHRLTDLQDDLGNTIHYTLDAMGNRTQEDVLDPQGVLKQTHARVYNSLNRLIKTIGAGNQTTQYAYDNNGNLTAVTDPLNQLTTHTYDKLNRLSDVQDPLNGHTQTQYDALDQILRIIDPLGSATDYAIDGLGNTEETDSPDTGITTRSFDTAGNLLTETDARGKTTSHQYDALNRRIQTTLDNGSQITYSYDAGTDNRGRLMQVTDPHGSTAWSYDAQGRITERRQQLDGIQLTVGYSYDTQGRLTQITYPSGRAVSLGYDAAGRIGSVQADGQTIVNQITYHPFGQPVSWHWANGTPYTRGLDLDGRISAYPLGGVTQSISYDVASRITGITDSTTKTYGYDALDRLTTVTAPGITQSYSYDANGNRLTGTLGSQTTTYNYGLATNRLQSRTQGTTQSYSYDAAGHLTDDGAHSFTYDDRGRMVQATIGALTTSYRYNGLGERVSKTLPGLSTVSHRFVYGEAGHLIGEYDASGAPIEETVYLGDLPLEILSGANGIHYVHADQINTPRAITDTQGTVRWKWEGDPFGVGAPDQDPDGDAVQFTYNSRFPGQYFDAETGLHYNYFRDYDPSLGRYIQSDPIGLDGGINTYLYANANPLSFTDPNGLFPFLVIPGICAAGGCEAAAAAIGLSAWMSTPAGQKAAEAAASAISEACSNDDDDCEREWEDARDYCDEVAAENGFGTGWNVTGRNYQQCVMGQVSERCGGNRVEHAPPPRKRRFFP
ncbi:MAG: RHS repeat-associated core domain-containing protein [Gammaproteobacteria bacterium]